MLEYFRQAALETTLEAATQELTNDSAYVAMEDALGLVILTAGGVSPVRVTQVVEQGRLLAHKRR